MPLRPARERVRPDVSRQARWQRKKQENNLCRQCGKPCCVVCYFKEGEEAELVTLRHCYPCALKMRIRVREKREKPPDNLVGKYPVDKTGIGGKLLTVDKISVKGNRSHDPHD